MAAGRQEECQQPMEEYFKKGWGGVSCSKCSCVSKMKTGMALHVRSPGGLGGQRRGTARLSLRLAVEQDPILNF